MGVDTMEAEVGTSFVDEVLVVLGGGFGLEEQEGTLIVC